MRLPDLQLQQKAAQFITQNSSGLLTAGGVIGVAATAVLTARASFKAAAIIREKVAIREAVAEEQGKISSDMTKREMAAHVWPQYIPPAVMGATTMVAIVMANRMSARRAAALAAAYSISETRLQEYKDKVTERLGITKERNLRDEVAQERINKNPPNKEVIIMGSGDVLCFESLTGRYFHSSVEIIKRAETKLITELFQTQHASLSEFFIEIGLDPTAFSDNVGWSTFESDPVEIKFSTTMTPDGRPCLVLDYSIMPKPDYYKLY
jgi:hypothetical protein